MDEEREPARRKAEPLITAGWLEQYALWYLERWPASTTKLRRALYERVDRSAAFHGSDPAEGRALADAEIARLSRIGLLDDERLAQHKASSLQRKGASRAKIRSKLFAAGIPSAAIDGAVAELGADGTDPDADPELEAARTWARKRRIGPWRAGPADADERRRELAKLGRAGFAFETARKIVDFDPDEEGGDAD